MPEIIQKREISKELHQAYLDYAMSVIVARALPDARDGLKPVQRRILYVMRELGLYSNAKFTKAANIVGNALARYHPHGDLATYEALVRMAQDFSLRYPLVWGQGNFGSIDGDPAAAYRYTESKLMPLAEEMLADIEKDTVDLNSNYDNTRQEPNVLPAKAPNLLLNGSVGIAVGMATNIPPHNLNELTEAAITVLANPKIKNEELLDIIKGPDFPTGGIIFGKKPLSNCYNDGRGSVVVRGRLALEEKKRGGQQIVVTEIPWQVNKAELVRQIAALSLEKTLPEIKDVRDESNKNGLRVVIELRQGDPNRVIEKLYHLTDLQKNYHFNLVALEAGLQPKLFNLKDLLLSWLGHRRQVIYRRTKFELNRVRERIHLLEGFEAALAKIDLVIAIIRKAKNKEEAREGLKQKLVLSEKQAEAILELPLRSLTALERFRLRAELNEKQKIEQQLQAILKDPKKIEAIIIQELTQIKEKFGDKRRTEIVAGEIEEKAEVIEDHATLLFIGPKGKVATLEPTIALDKIIKDKDSFGPIFTTRTTAKLWVATKGGKIYQVPISCFYRQSKYLESELILEKNDTILKAFIPQPTATYLLVLTKNGLGKKMFLSEALSQKRSGTQIIKLKNDQVADLVAYVKNNFIAVSRQGLALAFKDNLPLQGKAAQGVRLMKLNQDAAFSLCPFERNFLVFAFAAGFWKKISIKELNLQQRGGKGIKVFEVKDKLGPVVLADAFRGEETILVNNDKVIKVTPQQLPLQKRIHQPQKFTPAVSQVLIL